MLPALYEDGEDDRYAGAVYASGDGAVLYSATYGAGDGPGVVIYGGQGYGAGDQYGGGGLLYGAGSDGYGGRYSATPIMGDGSDETYGVLLDSVDSFDYLDSNGRYPAAAGAVEYGDGLYQAVPIDDASLSGAWLAEFEPDWKYT